MKDYTVEMAREEMRKKGKVLLNLHFDASRYIIGSIRFMDVVYSLPFLLLTVLTLLIFYKTGHLNSITIVIGLVPFLFSIALLSLKDSDRKNINQWNKILSKIHFLRRERTFQFTKEVTIDLSQDIRAKLGIFTITNGCYETLDSRLVKVLKVTSINISLMSPTDRERVFEGYQTFLNDLPRDVFDLQINQIVQPVNLKNYLVEIEQEINKERNFNKRLLGESYKNKIYQIQKSKNMVSRERYVILSTKNGPKALDVIDRHAESLKSQIRNMLHGRYTLDADILDNDALENLLYMSIDYENAQTNMDMTSPFKSMLSVGEKEFTSMQEDWSEKEKYTIY